jgi:DNA replication and repair protein RecF
VPLTSLRLRDFRCYTELACQFPQGTTLFIGDNAQGKTSILEAICVLLRLQSPRASKQPELIRFSTAGFALAGTADGRELRHFLENGKRALSVDGANTPKPAEYLAASGRVVWMGNSDLELVTGGGEPRRRYLDFLGSQLFPAYRQALAHYEKALKTRNFLLKRDALPAWDQIAAYTTILATQGDALQAMRAELLAKLAPHLATAHEQIGGSREELLATYAPGHQAPLKQALAAAREDEMRRRLTLVGPHRDDFQLRLNGMPAGQFASEGQQRTIALALKLSQSTLLTQQTEAPPLLLIDDVFGELDPRRRNALLSALPAQSQRIITTTTLQWMTDGFVPQATFEVKGHALQPWGAS